LDFHHFQHLEASQGVLVGCLHPVESRVALGQQFGAQTVESRPAKSAISARDRCQGINQMPDCLTSLNLFSVVWKQLHESKPELKKKEDTIPF
jgi:hypothetical protein